MSSLKTWTFIEVTRKLNYIYCRYCLLVTHWLLTWSSLTNQVWALSNNSSENWEKKLRFVKMFLVLSPSTPPARLISQSKSWARKWWFVERLCVETFCERRRTNQTVWELRIMQILEIQYWIFVRSRRPYLWQGHITQVTHKTIAMNLCKYF